MRAASIAALVLIGLSAVLAILESWTFAIPFLIAVALMIIVLTYSTDLPESP